MGIKDLYRNWTKKRDRAALQQAQTGTQMSGHERMLASEGIDALKADTAATADLAGAEAATSANDELA